MDLPGGDSVLRVIIRMTPHPHTHILHICLKSGPKICTHPIHIYMRSVRVTLFDPRNTVQQKGCTSVNTLPTSISLLTFPFLATRGSSKLRTMGRFAAYTVLVLFITACSTPAGSRSAISTLTIALRLDNNSLTVQGSCVPRNNACAGRTIISRYSIR
jgi:hypothetical protein